MARVIRRFHPGRQACAILRELRETQEMPPTPTSPVLWRRDAAAESTAAVVSLVDRDTIARLSRAGAAADCYELAP